MKLNPPLIRWGALALLAVATVVTLEAFSGNQQPYLTMADNTNDTIPKRNKVTRETDDRDLDKELRQLDKAQEQLEKMKEKDWNEVSRMAEESISRINFDKIQEQIDMATKSIDYEKINRQVQESLAKIDFAEIQRSIERSLDEVKKIDKEELRHELEKAQKHVQEALKKEEWKEELKKAQAFNRDEVKKELENARKEIAKVKGELKKQQFDFSKEMDKAKMEIDKAKTDMKGYQEMIYDMEAAGLLSTKEDYTIEYKNGDLFINDKKQPQEITDKYKKYFRQKTIAIKKQEGQMKIDH
ncbi:hypothetical protein [Longitalea luteola]|uniref:hypothetical protein n=1 Tax=Longitalea luteola TaxID=2812563 RepID=UPI001A97C37D|nr:hypothetical protein [Longitalea luteola]